VLEFSLRESLQRGHNYVGTEDILLGLIREGEGQAAQILVAIGGDLGSVREQVFELLAGAVDVRDGNPLAISGILEQFGNDLTQRAREGRLDPVVGRENEIQRVMQVLSRRTKNTPVLTGDSSAHNRAVVEGLAQEIARGRVPESLRNCILYELNVEALDVDGLGRAAALERLKEILKEVAWLEGTVLYLEALPTFMSAEEGDASLDATSLLRSHLARGTLRLIGAAMYDEYREYIDNEPAISQLFQSVDVPEPSLSDTVQILSTHRDRYEAHHRISITDSALRAAAALADKFLSDRFLPDSAILLLDEAGSGMRIRRVARPDRLRRLDDNIAAIRIRKEAAVDAQDFDHAASWRDREKELLKEVSQAERSWRAGDMEVVAEVDEEEVLEATAAFTGLPSDTIGTWYAARSTSDQHPQTSMQGEPAFALLNDEPLRDGQSDLLETDAMAEGLAALLASAPTPFVLALDGGWGMGKSTLLRKIEDRLPKSQSMLKVQFNAWTTQGETALDDLIKSVLGELDPSWLRRWGRRLARRRGLMGFLQIVLGMLARLFGVSNTVDRLWNQMGGDAHSQNQMRALVQNMLTDWVNQEASPGEARSLVVFIDDLDRCTDEVVTHICEAIKLYLGAPGLMFILACDMSVIARGVSTTVRGGTDEGRIYLEKIVQVAHRLPSPDRQHLLDLIAAYASESGTAFLMDDTVTEILASRSGGNPRRIKRIMNSFVLEYRLNSSWTQPPLGSVQLITAIILQHLYPLYYDWLVREGNHLDPTGAFLEYARVRRRMSDPPPPDDRWWSTTAGVFRANGLVVPSRRRATAEAMSVAAVDLDRSYPEGFLSLSSDDTFIALLEGIGNKETRIAFREQLMTRGLQTAPTATTYDAQRGFGEPSIEPTVASTSHAAG
jgi:hypothetical protein